MQLTFIGDSVSFTRRARPVDAAVRAGAGHRPGLDRRASTSTCRSARRRRSTRAASTATSSRSPAAPPRRARRPVSGQTGDVSGTRSPDGRHVRPAADADVRRRPLDVRAARRASCRRPRQLALTGDTYIDVQYASASTRPARPRLDHDRRRARPSAAAASARRSSTRRRRRRSSATASSATTSRGQFARRHRQRLVHRRLVAGHRGRPGPRRLRLFKLDRPGPDTRAPARPRSACSSSRSPAA